MMTGTTVEEIHRRGVMFASVAVHPPVKRFLIIKSRREVTTNIRLARDIRDGVVVPAMTY
jgi:hypothetical protein